MQESCGLDITKGKTFSGNQKIYKAVVGDLKKKDIGSVSHIQPIAHNDLKKNYSPDNIAFNVNTFCGLQKKV